MQLTVQPIWPWPIVAVAAAALVAFSAWTYTKGTPRRKLLLGLRIATIALAVMELLRPSLVFTKKHRQSSVLVVLTDKTKSMAIKDMWNNQSRWEVAKAMLTEAEPDFKSLAEEVRIQRFNFAKKLTEATGPGDAPTGDQTALGDSLQELLDRNDGAKMAGIVLLTDGANTTGISPVSVARQLGLQKIPIYAFGFGQEVANEQIRDISADNLLVNPTVFAKNKMTVRGELSAVGFSNRAVGVKLLLDGVEKARGSIALGRDTQKSKVDLTAIPETAGDLKVTIAADVQPQEFLTDNNSISTYVTVLAGGINVLEIEGKYRYWEPKFVRWALDQSPDIDLSQLFLIDSSGRKAEISADILKPGRFDVILLGDVGASQFSREQLTALRAMVDRGAGLMMMGGYESFGPGGWGDTPLADVLPVQMRSADTQLTQPIKMTPTADGYRHFLLRLSADENQNRKFWEAFRPLDGGSGFSGLKLGASILATGGDGVPVLVAQTVGASRTIAFSGDTTWRWRKTPETIAAHARYWRQLILWLAKKDEAGDAQIRVRLERRRLPVTQKLAVDIRVENADGTPASSAKIQAVVLTPEGKELPLDLLQQGTEFHSDFRATDAVGDYAVRVTAQDGARNLGVKTVKFLTYAEDNEMKQLAADHALLRAMADQTGGEFHTPEELRNFIRALKKRDLNLEVAQPVYESLWDRWETLALFVALLVTEWSIRKKVGLA